MEVLQLKQTRVPVKPTDDVTKTFVKYMKLLGCPMTHENAAAHIEKHIKRALRAETKRKTANKLTD